MSATKEAELTTAVLLYAVRCLAEGDQHALRAMSFGAKEVEAMHTLDLTDLYRVHRLQAHCLSIQLDRDVFWQLIAYLRHEREAAALQRILIQADAPFEMMQRLFGLSSR
ncbi:MAG: STY4526/YPO1902 family pathogenicity island replication protein, partial [Chromatiaceae bacterium]